MPKYVHVLTTDGPTSSCRSELEAMTQETGREEHQKELQATFENLGYKCEIVPLLLSNYKQKIAAIPRDQIIVNFCDGSDIDGSAGPCVAEYLEKIQFPRVFGCTSDFLGISSLKHKMKDVFYLHNVSTPPGIVIPQGAKMIHQELCNLTFPLFVKPSDSYASVGISVDSLCKSISDVESTVKRLQTVFSAVIVEEFIEGPEYTVLVSGDCTDPQTIFVFPPAQRVFLEDLPAEQKFLTFTRNWVTSNESFTYAQVENQVDVIALRELARRAYIAVGGSGYGRVDIRKREATKRFFVLEVDAACSIGSDTSADNVLKLAGLSTADFISFILHGAAGALQQKEADEGLKAASEQDEEEEAEVQPPMIEKRTFQLVSRAGKILDDEYHWLQNADDPDVMAYVEAENAYSSAIMADTKDLQETLCAEFAARTMESDESPMIRNGDWYYYTVKRRDRPYTIHYRRFEDHNPEVILDENEWAEGEDFFAVGVMEPSHDHNLLALTTDTSGNEHFTLYIKNLLTTEHQILDEAIPNVSWWVRWASDHKTLFYVTSNEANRPYRLYKHVVGTDPPNGSKDELIYEETDMQFYLTLTNTKSQRFLLLTCRTQDTYEVKYLEAGSPDGQFQFLIPRQPGLIYTVEHHGAYFYVLTNDAGASPNYRVVRMPIAGPHDASTWEEVLPHNTDTIVERVECFRHHLVIWEFNDAKPRIRVQDLSDGEVHYVDLKDNVCMVIPGVSFWNMDREEISHTYFNTTHLTFTYASQVQPPTVYDYDMDNRTRSVVKTVSVLGYLPEKYKQEMLWATAPDGERIPISLVYHVERRTEGEPAPLLLYGYGSYCGYTDTGFCSYRVSLLDRGFIYAVAHVRGDTIKGTYWYDQGRLLKKKQTFSDFLCCAKFLIKENYTTPNLLAASGRSAGGLICGAMANNEENLFSVIITDVPFLDVVGSLIDYELPWTAHDTREWGNPQDPVYWDYMMEYSPVANVKAKPYPHMMFTCGLNDARVGWWESAKMVLRIREKQTNDSHVLLVTRLEGHLGAASRSDADCAMAFKYAFLITKLLGKSGLDASQSVAEYHAALPGVESGTLTPLDLYRMFQGFHLTMLLHAALDLGIFECLDLHGPSPARFVAKALGADKEILGRILDGLVAVGLLERTLKDAVTGTAVYALASIAASCLVPGRPAYLGAMRSLHLQPRTTGWLTELADVVKGTSNDTPLQELKRLEYLYGAYLHQQVCAKIVQIFSPWATKRKQLHILDMTCAGDTLACRLLEQAPFSTQARLWVLVPSLIRQLLDPEDLPPGTPRSRIHIIEGDHFTNVIGPYDLVIACNLFSYLLRDECRLLLNRINAMLQPTGRLVIVDYVSEVDAYDAPTQLEAVAVSAHRKGGGVFSLPQYQTMLAKAGFIPPLIHAIDAVPHKLLITAKNIIGSL
eukprot:TRINITY_DN5149_c0_g1_i1.p1 TRINITY_DN5149_c0_g1~~TRINITY_DN5149_c0_g1_i1.p1  ORF type:complete len:1420 (+),score=234.28 TRINITY_DN5149_c0_g1_i1:1875-6134(+)